jgi:hypothetical protein
MHVKETAMPVTIRAHFDGKVIVPDEPVDLPVDQPLQVELRLAEPEAASLSMEERRAALERFLSRPIHGLSIPDEALSRENLYEERR